MKPPPIFFPGELEENPVVAQIAIYGGVTWDGLILSRWDSLLSESQVWHCMVGAVIWPTLTACSKIKNRDLDFPYGSELFFCELQ
jgi:hypothetical protein